MKKRFFYISLLLIIYFLFACTSHQKNELPDCGIPENRMNNEIEIYPFIISNNIHPVITAKIINNTDQKLISEHVDLSIKLFWKNKGEDEWQTIHNKTNYIGTGNQKIKSNASILFGFYPDLRDFENKGDIYVCVFLKIEETDELVGASMMLSIN